MGRVFHLVSDHSVQMSDTSSSNSTRRGAQQLNEVHYNYAWDLTTLRHSVLYRDERSSKVGETNEVRFDELLIIRSMAQQPTLSQHYFPQVWSYLAVK